MKGYNNLTLNNKMPEIANIDFKLTLKQQALLDVLSSLEYANETHKKKAELAGMNEASYYRNMRNKEFLQALQYRGVIEAGGLAIPIMKRMCKDALQGKYMQQRTVLETVGIIRQSAPSQPLINVIINQNTGPKEDIDKLIVDKIIDLLPTDIQSDKVT